MKKKPAYFLLIFSFLFLFAKKAAAVCPLCAVAVGSGIGLSRWLGVDDSITGLWIGGLVVSMIMWTISWFDKKNIHFKARNIITAFGFYVLTIAPLYFYGLMESAGNKLPIGIILGSSAFYFGACLYFYLKEKNGGKAYFPFQKVAMPVSPLIILSIIFYFLTK